ncbi:acyltransferase [Curvibacter sp. HBC28]|uniref:Acyltransferase n=1 Tax=Curvibacter microcysteis TaxID=3026419 RepID=A0ABT5MIY5_9BURK|nr:acyltransferase [Curvibacter sp. HBC28]MDD0815101.1 acyltransferase [Curvibacter sp. HBC28]
MTSSVANRMPLVDALKGLACVLIVSHHLAFYGPMSDVALPLAPGLISWLYDYGRFAVQVFLVVAGFLTAGQLSRFARSGQRIPVLSLFWQRYLRLAVPYVAALLVALVMAAVLRPWWHHESLPSKPDFWRVLSHVFMLHGWVGHESLSAGVWYVAIDLQLYALAVLVFFVGQKLAGPHEPTDLAGRARLTAWVVSLTTVLMLASLFFFNRDAGFDVTGVYFFGAYALGLMTRWASGRRHPWAWLAALWAVACLALMLEFRERIAVALLTSVVLGCVLLRGAWAWLNHALLSWLGRISYSVFLIHFPVCLAFNAVWAHFFPAQPWLNVMGMVLALMSSLICGHAFYALVEERGSTRLIGLLAARR